MEHINIFAYGRLKSGVRSDMDDLLKNNKRKKGIMIGLAVFDWGGEPWGMYTNSPEDKAFGEIIYDVSSAQRERINDMFGYKRDDLDSSTFKKENKTSYSLGSSYIKPVSSYVYVVSNELEEYYKTHSNKVEFWKKTT